MPLCVPERWLLSLCDPRQGAPLTSAMPPPLADAEVAPFLTLADLHRVIPAVFANASALPGGLGRLYQHPDSPRVAELVTLARRRLAERAAMSLYLTGETVRLLGLLSAAGIRAIPLKGADFAARLYPSASLRPFVDVDLLVDGSAFGDAGRTLCSAGFSTKEDRLKHDGGYAEETFTHPEAPGLSVELHSNLVNSPTIRRGVSVALDDLPLAPARRGGMLPTPESLLVIGAVHGAASHGFDKLQHLCDVAQAARGAAGPVDPAVLREIAARTGAGLSIALGLHLAHRTLACTASADLLRRSCLHLPKTARALVTPAVVVRGQGPRRWRSSWRRQWLRHLLKRRPDGASTSRSPEAVPGPASPGG